MKPRNLINSQRHFEFRNDSGETIPAFAVLMPTGMTTQNGRPIITVDKPNGYGARSHYMINGPYAVVGGGIGVCTNSFPTVAFLNDGSSAITAGSEVGPVAGEWGLDNDSVGFLVYGDLSPAQPELVYVVREPVVICLGKTDETIGKGNSGTVSVYAGTTLGNEVDTGINITAYNRYKDLPANLWCRARYVEGGWELFVAECSQP